MNVPFVVCMYYKHCTSCSSCLKASPVLLMNWVFILFPTNVKYIWTLDNINQLLTSLGWKYHHWSTRRPPILVGDPHIFIKEPIFSLETRLRSYETPLFSLVTPLFTLETPYFRWGPPLFCWRPPYFHCWPHIFVGDPIISLENPMISLEPPRFSSNGYRWIKSIFEPWIIWDNWY